MVDGQRKKRNLELPARVDALLDAEARAGSTVTSTISAAVYWFFNRLEPHERETARQECAEWVDTGEIPASAVASDVQNALRAYRQRRSEELARRSAEM